MFHTTNQIHWLLITIPTKIVMMRASGAIFRHTLKAPVAILNSWRIGPTSSLALAGRNCWEKAHRNSSEPFSKYFYPIPTCCLILRHSMMFYSGLQETLSASLIAGSSPTKGILHGLAPGAPGGSHFMLPRGRNSWRYNRPLLQTALRLTLAVPFWGRPTYHLTWAWAITNFNYLCVYVQNTVCLCTYIYIYTYDYICI